MSQQWKSVPVEPTEHMLNVMHDRVLISVNTRKEEARIVNDKEWWSMVVAAAPQPPALGCCEPTAEEKAMLENGDYTPEELWGGSRPTCPKCHGKTHPLLAEIENERKVRMSAEGGWRECFCVEHGLHIETLKARNLKLEGLLCRVIKSGVLALEDGAPEDLESLETDICAALNPAEGRKS